VAEAPPSTSPPAAAAAGAAPPSVPLRLGRKRPSPSAEKKASLWALTRDDDAGTPTIDESALLTPADLARREAVQRPDCDVKRTRKACKNCSCGLRELLLQEADDLPSSGRAADPTAAAGSALASGVQRVSAGAVTSSCGSCYLGDAFRCSSCPYLGLPPFEPGQKVEVPAGFGDDI
jgi:hypothetical protein